MGIALQGILVVLLLVMGVAVPTMLIFKLWLVDATMDAGAALCSLLALMVLTATVWQTQGTVWMFAAVLLLVAGSALLPMLAGSVEKSGRNRLRDEDIQKFQRAISFDPANAGARASLAEKYMEARRYYEAAAEYQRALQLIPDSPKARQWTRRLEEAANAAAGHKPSDFTVCPGCNENLPLGLKSCPRCGTIIRMGFMEWVARPENFSVILRQTISTMLVLVVLLAVFSALPLEIKGCVLCASAIVAAWYFLRGIDGSV